MITLILQTKHIIEFVSQSVQFFMFLMQTQLQNCVAIYFFSQMNIEPMLCCNQAVMSLVTIRKQPQSHCSIYFKQMKIWNIAHTA